MAEALPALACDSCLCTVLGRRDEVSDGRKPIFLEFLAEQQNWNEVPAEDAHELHMQGRHVHDKTHEEFYHFQAGVHPHERLTILADLPYVVRTSIEVEDEDRLGQKQSSEGWGDLSLIGIWRSLQNEKGFLGVTGGVKFPTGATDRTNPAGETYEVELQPGSGSYDYPIGGVFSYSAGPARFKGNAVYIVKTEGVREFEFGDVFSASLVSEADLGPVALGLDLNFQHERKQTDHGITVEDSGGDILFAGPSLTIPVNANSLVYGTFLFPVFQDMGGVHQKLDFIWTAGGRITF